MPSRYDAIPDELRWSRAWCLAAPLILPPILDAEGNPKPDKSPHFLRGGKLYKASPTNPKHWSMFEECLDAVAAEPRYEIGFVLSAADPYTCIDLDVKDATNETDSTKWTTPEQLDRFEKIVATFNSYTERSRSGRGLHIWVRGSIGAGCRRDGVEVYSQERFIIFTGNVYRDLPIEPRQELLNVLIAEIGNADAPSIELVEIGEVDSDAVIYERALGAENGSKFAELWNGNWKGQNYPSQSEADLALLSILAFYSRSNEQVRRLFRHSGLGQREKAVKNNVYLDRTLGMIRGRQERDNTAELVTAALAANLIAALNKAKPTVADVPELPKHGEIDWPPGLTGEIAKYIYQSSPRPVKEVSIVAALGFIAGICGKTFNIPQSGLNVYIVLVARSGVGKEAMHSGIANLLAKARESVPSVMRFIDFSDFASGPALSKAVAENPSFCNVAGEWGQKLKRLGNESGKDGAMHSLRTAMTNLYQKSGPLSIVGGIGYSDKDKNVMSVSGVAYSMIGETTPGVFYESLTESMMEDGFLSRFTVVTYLGDRPPANPNIVLEPRKEILDAFCGLCVHSLTLLDRFQTQAVTPNAEAHKMLLDFDKHCDGQINATDIEGWRQMWNRAHLKAYRFSALLAAADNPINPVIEKHHAEWALRLVSKDIEIIQKRIKVGDIGEGDSQRERKLIEIIKGYLSKPVAAGYKMPDGLRVEGLIPHRYLSGRVTQIAAFSKHRLGLSTALEQSIKSLLACGYLVEPDKSAITEKHKFHGKVYRVVYLPLDVE